MKYCQWNKVLGSISVVVTIYGIYYHLNDPASPQGESVTKANDSLIVAAPIAAQRLQDLREHTRHDQSLSAQTDLAREDIRMQARLFYAAILAGLITASVIPSDLKKKRLFLASTSIAIILMYAFDIQTLYQSVRYDQDRARTNETMTQLMKVSPNDLRWYEYSQIANTSTANPPTVERVWLKCKLALHPGLDQIIFYLAPLMLICGFHKRLSE